MSKSNFFSKAVAMAMILLGLTFVSCDKFDNPLPSAWDGVTPNLPLTLEAVDDGATMNVTFTSTLPKVTVIQYSTDGGQSWKYFTISGGKPRYGSSTLGAQAARPARRTISGVKQILIKAENESYWSDETGDLTDYRDGQLRNLNISVNADCYIYGNIMSLVGGEQFSTKTDLSGKCNFFGLFKGNANLKSHPTKQLLLPATTLTENCYCDLFRDCTALTAAPALPATKLAYNCYGTMFYGCTALTAAPELPATELAKNCYQHMFIKCTALTAAPTLPATELADSCYWNMFSNCTALTTAPELPATKLAENCYGTMFYGCTALTTAPELPATKLANRCYYQMFEGCTALTTAPALPATKLAKGCYDCMFTGCVALTTAPELPATELAEECYMWMFASCTSLTKAPVLPAKTLVSGCYNDMFYNCTNLNYIKCLATSIADGASLFTFAWTDGVAGTGTFVCADKTEYGSGKFWDPTISHVSDKCEAPYGWTAKNPDEE